MLAKVARPCSIAAHDGGEIVVEQHEVGGLARDVGAGAAHRDADVGLVQRRSVVDPVAGHRHHVAASPQRRRDPQLVLRRDPGDDHAVAVEQRAEHRLVGRQVDALSTSAVAAESPTSRAIAAAVAGWSPVIIATVMPARRQAASAAAASAAAGPRRRRRPSSSGRPQRSRRCQRGWARVDGSRATARTRRPCGTPGRPASAPPSPCRRHSGSTASGAPFTSSAPPANDRHPSSPRVEREALQIGLAALVGSPSRPSAAGEHVERRLHRVALGRPRPSRWTARAGRAAGRRRAPARAPPSAPAALHSTPAGRVVAVARRSASSRRRPYLDDGHLVAGQRAGLVGADEGRRTQRLDRLQAPHQRVAVGHALRAHASDSVTVGSRPSGTSATVTPIANRKPSVSGSADQQRDTEERRRRRRWRWRRSIRTTRPARGQRTGRPRVARVRPGDPGQAVAARPSTTARLPRPRPRTCRRERSPPSGRAGTLSPVIVEVSIAEPVRLEQLESAETRSPGQQHQVADHQRRRRRPRLPRHAGPWPAGQQVVEPVGGRSARCSWTKANTPLTRRPR